MINMLFLVSNKMGVVFKTTPIIMNDTLTRYQRCL